MYAAMRAQARGMWVLRERAAPVEAASESVDPEDELYLLGERCAATYMQAEVLKYEAMLLLAEFDERGGWRNTGFGSSAEWLAWRVGIKRGPARERVRTARALRELPLTSAAMREGELSFTKVRALTRVAGPASEAALLELARSCSAAKLERLARGWTELCAGEEAKAEERRHRSRTFSVFPDEDGMYVVRGRLDPEVGAALMRAIEAASDALYGAEREGADAPGAEPDQTKPEQRRADAVGLVAERALAAGFTDGPLSGSRAERYQVMLHVEEATLAGAEDRSGHRVPSAHGAAHVSAETSGEQVARAGGPPRSELGDGVRVSAETSRRIACDAAVVRITRGRDGGVLGA
ncbi:MAG: DUF222 domain-containing protein, partial [Gemmatimonadota bacterium]